MMSWLLGRRDSMQAMSPIPKLQYQCKIPIVWRMVEWREFFYVPEWLNKNYNSSDSEGTQCIVESEVFIFSRNIMPSSSLSWWEPCFMSVESFSVDLIINDWHLIKINYKVFFKLIKSFFFFILFHSFIILYRLSYLPTIKF